MGRYGEIAVCLSCVAFKPSDMSQRHVPELSPNERLASRQVPRRDPRAAAVRAVRAGAVLQAAPRLLQRLRDVARRQPTLHLPGLLAGSAGRRGRDALFPRLNITVDATPYAALLFNNCLDNGEPDERTLHEGLPPLTATKYAINGWMHSKAFSGASLD